MPRSGTYFREFRQPPVLESFDRESLRYTTRSAARAITVRDLLTHTAGYGYWFLNPELRALLTGDPEYYDPPFLMHEPGTRFQYGVSTDVLGQLIAPVSGSPLAEFFSRRLFEPLGMRDTGFDVPRDGSRLANVQVRREDGFIELPNEAAGESPRGGGGLYSTADDYLALLRLLLRSGEHDGRRLLAARSVRELASNQIGGLRAERQTTAAPERTCDFLFMDGTQQFGLGVLVETRVRHSGRAAGSYGWAGILNTYFWVDPAADLAAVVLMQQSPFATGVCVDLCDAFELGVYRELTTLDKTKQ